MKRCLVLAFCVLSVLTRTRAQVSPSPPNTATLAGAVVKEPGDQPLKKVLLHVIAEDQKQGGNYTAETDSEGRFRIEKVQPGRYRIMLEKAGFHQINLHGHQTPGSILTVQAGQEINDLLLQMLQAAVITGRVVDEDGDPLPNFGVSLLRKRPGKSREPEAANNDRTNDLGEYRFGGLFPGQYFVAVVPPPDLRSFEHLAKGSDAAATKPDQNYLTTYYPGTTDIAQSAAISLRAGDEMPVNFTMIPGRTYRVRGIVTGIPANQKPMVQFIARGVNTSFNGADVAPDGQFEVLGVAPGSYSITVFSSSEGQILSAHQGVTVVAADVEGLKLTPSRPFTVSGHLRFEGWTSTHAADLTVSLRPSPDADDQGFSIASDGWNAQVDRFGNFQWTNVTPGNYVVGVYREDGSNSFLKSAMLGGSNADAGFNATGPAAIELVIGTKGGVLEGAVLDHDKPASNATVVAIPEEKYRKLHERYGTGATDQRGHFTIRGLAPGGYTLYAWQDLDDVLYYDAAFLKSQESSGVTLKVEEGSRQKVELKVSPMGEEWQ
jgi:protocatechuate 3,4-dioxygenase beta subunit